MNPEDSSANSDKDAKSIRLLRPSIVVLCGPAACGKSTFAQRHFRLTQIVSSDWARAHICDDERDQRFNAQAFALVYFLVEQRLMVNRLCVVDSTALTAMARKELLDLAKKHQVPTTLILFNVPLETCIERDKIRDRTVGSAVVERQHQAFEQNKEIMRQEGFDQVLEFQERDLEKAQIEILFRPVARPAPRPQRPDSGASRRSDRPSQGAKPRPSDPGDNGHSASRVSGPAAVQTPVPRPATTTSSVSTPKSASTRPGQTPGPETTTRPPSTAPPSAPPGVVKKPVLQPPAVVSPKPAPNASAQPVRVDGPTSSAR